MIENKRPATSPKVTGPIESNAAAKLVISLDGQGSGENLDLATLRAQLGIVRDSGTPTARVLAVIPRELWSEAIVTCPSPGCGGTHRHHVGHQDGRVERKAPCGAVTYVVELPPVLPASDRQGGGR